MLAQSYDIAGAENPGQYWAVLALVRRLADEQAIREHLIAGWREDRAWVMRTLGAAEYRSYVIRPAHLLDAAAAMRTIDRGIDRIEHPRLPCTMPGGRWAPANRLVQYTAPLTQGSDVSQVCTRLWVMHCAEQQCTAIALATALYRCDHGRYPNSLGELVPVYLDEVPKDPSALDGGEIRYWLTAQGRRPVLCLAGDDAVVQTKDAATIPTRAMYGRQDTTGAVCDDQFRDLSAWVDPNPPPTVPGSEPATEPVALPADTGNAAANPMLGAPEAEPATSPAGARN